MDMELPLQGLYLLLVRAGFPLSVRDYQDALVALRRGYGSPRREDLHWLCATLWARTDQELSRLDRLFREFRWPSSDEVAALVDRPTTQTSARRSRTRQSAARRDTGDRQREHLGAVAEFRGPSESGIGLPSAITPERRAEVFILTRRPLVPLRALVIAWRRMRLAQRSGPRVELDMDATVAEQSRHGILVEPVFIPARRNHARLIVLMDLSESMAPWRHMHQLLAESLTTSQLAHTALYYFDGVPDGELYEQAAISRPIDIEQAVRAHPRCALLILSDAGAAMGTRNRERLALTRRFVNAVKQEWSPIAWLNPMPPHRWTNTSANDIGRMKTLAMYPFTDDGLIQAVDYLRGKRD